MSKYVQPFCLILFIECNLQLEIKLISVKYLINVMISGLTKFLITINAVIISEIKTSTRKLVY